MSLDTHSKAQALEEWTNKRAEEGRRKAEEERRRKEEAAAARKQANKAETLRVLEQQIKEKVRGRTPAQIVSRLRPLWFVVVSKRRAHIVMIVAVWCEQQETRRKLRAAAIAERQATERRIRDAKKAVRSTRFCFCAFVVVRFGIALTLGVWSVLQESEEKRRAREKNLQYKKELEAQIKIRAKELPDPYFHMNNTERMVRPHTSCCAVCVIEDVSEVTCDNACGSP